MRFTVSPEQLKFFQLNGYLELEDLLSDEEVFSLMAAIDNIQKRSPGYPDENFFRSIPFIIALAKKRGWGQIAVELLHKKPLRVLSDRFFDSSPKVPDCLDDESCGLLIELKTRKGVFFKSSLPMNLYKPSSNSYFLLILTAKHLPEQLNPLIIK